MDGFKNIEIKNFRGIDYLKNLPESSARNMDAEYLEALKGFLNKHLKD